ncbi:MAG: hypothetical protein R3B90_16590 [Planctomycetaceae bacterium]
MRICCRRFRQRDDEPSGYAIATYEQAVPIFQRTGNAGHATYATRPAAQLKAGRN